MMDRLRPRLATVADAEEINAIYNYYVRTSAATFQVEDETTEERVEELRTRPGNQPLIVLEADHAVVGWGRSRLSARAVPIEIRWNLPFTYGTIVIAGATDVLWRRI